MASICRLWTPQTDGWTADHQNVSVMVVGLADVQPEHGSVLSRSAANTSREDQLYLLNLLYESPAGY
jgi:hypothetical protein